MKLIEINRNTIINADYIREIKIDYPNKGKVTISFVGGNSYQDVELSWLEWTDIRKRIGLYDVTTVDAVDVG